MNALVRFTRFDLVTIALTQPLRVLLPLLFTVVFCVTLPVPGLGIAIGAIVASVSASVPFQGTSAAGSTRCTASRRWGAAAWSSAGTSRWCCSRRSRSVSGPRPRS
ncbi:hypothetical protein P9139_11250 [Curtobacterium flaccumfaciens]|nr:hypothetical protein P9139_11250 [Curtobacterium flaccumfaciens]